MTELERRPDGEALWGALAYLFTGIGGVVVLLVRRDAFSRFHALQSIIATIVLFLAGLVLRILAHLPIFGFLYAILFRVFQLGVFALWVFLIYQAWQGRRYGLPFIGAWAAGWAGDEEPQSAPADPDDPEAGTP